MRAERITEPIAHHGEAPVWETATDRLLWVDMFRGEILSLVPSTGEIERRCVSAVAACVVPRTGGGHVVATERGFLLTDPQGAIVEVIPDLWEEPDVRMNDGGCDPQGRLYCGSMAYDAEPGRGYVYRLDPDRRIYRVLGPVTISNGIGWSPDGHTVYYVDSATRRIDAFSFDEENGRPVDSRVLVVVSPDAGLPDGLAVDGDGGVWVALWGGGVVHRYTPDGRLDAIVELSARQPTSCAFGGPDLTDLYITTSAHDLPPGSDPDAGAVFVTRPGVAGLPTNAFAG